MTDLVKRLRQWATKFAPADSLSGDLLEAACRIEELEAALNGVYDAYMELTFDMPVAADAKALEAARRALKAESK